MVMEDSSKTVMAAIMLTIGIGIAVLVLIFVGVMGGQTYTITAPQIAKIGTLESQPNETVTLTNGSNTTLTHDSVVGTLLLFNSTETLGSGNYTLFATDGQVFLYGTYDFGGGYNATYSFRNASVRKRVQSGISESFGALEQTGSFLPIIVLAIVIFIVLTLVLGMGMLGGYKCAGRGGAL